MTRRDPDAKGAAPAFAGSEAVTEGLPVEVARIAVALVHTVHQATARVDAEEFDERLRALIDRACDLHAALRAQLQGEDCWQLDEARTICDDTAATLEQLGKLFDESTGRG